MRARTRRPSRWTSWPATSARPPLGRVSVTEHPHGGGLARAVRAEQREDLAAVDLERQVAHGVHRAVALLEVLGQDRGAHEGLAIRGRSASSSSCQRSSASSRSSVRRKPAAAAGGRVPLRASASRRLRSSPSSASRLARRRPSWPLSSSGARPADQVRAISTARERRSRRGQRPLALQAQLEPALVGDPVHRAHREAALLLAAHGLDQPLGGEPLEHPVEGADLDVLPALDLGQLGGAPDLVAVHGAVGQEAEDEQPAGICFHETTSHE